MMKRVRRLRIAGRLSAAGFCLAVGAGAASGQSCNLPTGGSAGLTQVFDEINAQRVLAKIDILYPSAPLMIAAQTFACNLANGDPGMVRTLDDRQLRARSSGCRARQIDETLIVGPLTGADVIGRMRADASLRRAALASRMRDIGLGVAVDTGPDAKGATVARATYWVVTFSSGC